MSLAGTAAGRLKSSQQNLHNQFSFYTTVMPSVRLLEIIRVLELFISSEDFPRKENMKDDFILKCLSSMENEQRAFSLENKGFAIFASNWGPFRMYSTAGSWAGIL